jgi:hypothetical protein
MRATAGKPQRKIKGSAEPQRSEPVATAKPKRNYRPVCLEFWHDGIDSLVNYPLPVLVDAETRQPIGRVVEQRLLGGSQDELMRIEVQVHPDEVGVRLFAELADDPDDPRPIDDALPPS